MRSDDPRPWTLDAGGVTVSIRLTPKGGRIPPRDVVLTVGATARVKRLTIAGNGPALTAALEKICAPR